jgi:hypothetical protein
MRWAGQVLHIGKIKTYKILVRKPKVKRSLEKPRHRQEDNIKTDLGKTGW